MHEKLCACHWSQNYFNTEFSLIEAALRQDGKFASRITVLNNLVAKDD